MFVVMRYGDAQPNSSEKRVVGMNLEVEKL